MKRNLYFVLALIFSIPIVELVVAYLLQATNARREWTQPTITLLIGLFWIEFFRVKNKENGLWQIVSSSIRDKLSLFLHLIICTFLTAWTFQLDVIPIYIVSIWLFFLLLIGLSFYLSSTQEAKPLIKRYLFGKW
jgi:hypothetical protein